MVAGGKKCDEVVVVVVGGKDNKHKMPLKDKYVAIVLNLFSA